MRLWQQLIQIKDPNPSPNLLSDSQVFLDYDHDPDTDTFTVDFSGGVLTSLSKDHLGIAIAALAQRHPHVVLQEFNKIVPAQYHPMYGDSTEGMERAVMQYQGYGQKWPVPGRATPTGTQTTTTTTSSAGANGGMHTHQVVFPQPLFPQERLKGTKVVESLDLLLDDMDNVYSEAEDGSAIEILAAAMLDLVRLIKENL